MPKYIDADYADALAKDLFKGQIGITFYQAVHAMLEAIKPIDAVPVVKCFACQYRNKVECPAYRKLVDTDEIITPPYVHFCSYGERKDDSLE